MFRLKRTCVQGKTPLRFRLNALAFEVKRTCVFSQIPKRFLRGYIFFLKQQKKNVIPEVRKTPESLCGNDIPYFNLSLAAHSHARHLKYPKISSQHLLFLLHQLRHLHSTSDRHLLFLLHQLRHLHSTSDSAFRP